MTNKPGWLDGSAAGGAANGSLTKALHLFAFDDWPPHKLDRDALLQGSLARNIAATHPRAIAGAVIDEYMADYYFRIHVRPVVLSLGNVTSAQDRTVEVWNAWPHQSATLTAITITSAQDITLTGQPALPITFTPLQSLNWNAHIGTRGASVINAAILWTFTGVPSPTMLVLGNRLLAWIWRPDWSEGILETLEWRTDIIPAEQDTEQRISMRDTPRQTWEFSVTPSDIARQHMANALIGSAMDRWAVPQWPHGANLTAPAASGSTTLAAPTDKRGFVVGGGLLLLDDETGAYETATVDALASTTITTALPLANSWRAGAVVAYPTKPSILDDAGTLEHFTGATDTARVRFRTDEPVPHDSTIALPTYRGIPVLEDIPDWTSAPTLKPERLLSVVDNETSLPLRFDHAGVPMLTQDQHWTPVGRAAVDRMRSLQYLLRGARGSLWVPTWTQDLTLAIDAAVGVDLLQIVDCAYAISGNPTLHRQDIRIQSAAGVEYHRIIAAEAAGGIEALTLDEVTVNALSAAAGAVTITFMALLRQDSDRNEWNWWSGDMGADQTTADVPMSMRSFSHDL